MKRNLLKTFIVTFLLLCGTFAKAQDYVYVVDDIYYNKISETEVEICGCYSGITDLVIPDIISIDNGDKYNVTSIAAKAFRWKTGLESVTIGENITTIGEEAFWECSNLERVYMGKSVTTIGEWAFYYCNNISGVYIKDLSAWCKIDFSNGSHPLSYAKNKELYLNGEKLTDLVIPNDITEIKSNTFGGCTSIESVTIPGNVTTIIGGFNQCRNIKKVILSEGVTNILGGFSGCTSLTSITIPSSVTTIGERAFYCCYRLKVVYNNSSLNIIAGSEENGDVAYYAGVVITKESNVNIVNDFIFQTTESTHTLAAYIGKETNITLPQSYNNENYSIGNNAFSWNENITSITIPDGVTAIGDYTFDGCSNLANVVIGNGVTSIGSFAFSMCQLLASIALPNSVTKIGDNAFCWNTNLKNVVISKNVRTIEECAFWDCPNLINITSYISAENLFPIAANVFSGMDKSICTLNVPVGSKEAYANTDYWNEFANIVEFEVPLILKCATPTLSYIDGVLKIECETEDAEFVTTITDNDIATHYTKEIELSVTYNISAYATKSGYENSDIITATLCWIDSTPVMEDITTEIKEVTSTPLLISSHNGVFTITGEADGTRVGVYTTDGIVAGGACITNGAAVIKTDIEKGNIAIISAGGKNIKVFAQ